MGATKLVIIGLLISALFWSCSSKLSEEEYYNKAREAYGKEKYEEALQNFKLLVQNYPQGKRAAEASFMLGFINANDLKNYEEAKKYYTEFIKKYPDHELADDAQYELNNLGKDINELPIFQNIAADTAAKK